MCIFCMPTFANVIEEWVKHVRYLTDTEMPGGEVNFACMILTIQTTNIITYDTVDMAPNIYTFYLYL